MSGPGGPPDAPVETWRRTFASRWALVSVAALLYWVASHSLRPFIALRLDVLGASPQEVGLVASAYASLALLLAIPGGRAVDRLGTGRVLYGALLAMVGLGLAYARATTIPVLFVLQLVHGVVELGVWLSIQTLATHAGSGDSLAKHLSLFSFAWGLGIAVGPTIGGAVYEGVGFAGLAILYSAIAGGIMLVMLYAPRSEAVADEGGGLGRDAVQVALQPAIRSVLLSTFVAMYVISIKSTFYPLSLAERGISASSIGVLLSVMGVASLAVRLALPAALLRWGARTVLLLGTTVGVVAISATPWLLHPALLALGAALAGAGYGSNPPVAMQLLGEHSTASNRGLVMGLRAAASRLAQVLQPLVFGSLVTAAGMALAFPLSGLALGGVVFWTRRDLGALEREQPHRTSVGGPSP